MIYVLGKLFCSLYIFLFHPFNVKGVENIPEHGSAILVANHQSNWDPILLALLTYRVIHYLGKIELFKNSFLAWVFKQVYVIPVNRKKPEVKTMRECLAVLKSGGLLGIFPEGTRVKNGERKEPLDGFIHFAFRTKSPIIPVHIYGSMKPWHKLNIVIGEPLYLNEQYAKRPDNEKVSEIAKNVMDKIYHLN